MFGQVFHADINWLTRRAEGMTDRSDSQVILPALSGFVSALTLFQAAHSSIALVRWLSRVMNLQPETIEV